MYKRAFQRLKDGSSVIIISVVFLFSLISSCERRDAGHPNSFDYQYEEEREYDEAFDLRYKAEILRDMNESFEKINSDIDTINENLNRHLE